MKLRVFSTLLIPVLALACGGSQKDAPAPATSATAQAPVRPAVPPIPPDAYGFSAQLTGTIPPLVAGVVTEVRLVIRNESAIMWPGKALAETASPLCASYHILDQKGDVVTHDGNRTPIDVDVMPGGEVTVTLQVSAPQQPGRYQLQPDVLQEQVAWFGMTPPVKKNRPVAIVVKAGQ